MPRKGLSSNGLNGMVTVPCDARRMLARGTVDRHDRYPE
jgi:hypothetical protein